MHPILPTFPNQRAISAYIYQHPITHDVFALTKVNESYTVSIEKVSAYFSGRTMPMEQIWINLIQAFSTREVADLLDSVQTSYDEALDRDEPREVTESMRSVLNAAPQLLDCMTRSMVDLHDTILTDLLDGVYYSPPGEGETKWKRHTQQMN